MFEICTKQDLEKTFSFPTYKKASIFLGTAKPWLTEMSKGVTECIDIPQRLSTEMGRGPLGTFLSSFSSMYLIQTLSAGRRLGLRGDGAPWSLSMSFEVLPLTPSKATEHLQLPAFLLPWSFANGNWLRLPVQPQLMPQSRPSEQN